MITFSELKELLKDKDIDVDITLTAENGEVALYIGTPNNSGYEYVVDSMDSIKQAINDFIESEF